MTNIDRAEQVIQGLVDHPETPEIVARALAADGLLAPEPQIIRTREELAALDPDTLLFPAYQFTNGWRSCNQKCVFRAEAAYRLDLTFHGPAVVLATGEQVRAARQAQEVTDDRWNLPSHRTEAGYPNCSTCDGGGCPDCTDPA